MSDSLRSRVVEAGARALYERMFNWPMTGYPTQAEVVVDAMLDCLTENADEWIATTESLELDDAVERGDHKLADVLLAVLRNPAEETDTP